METQDNIQCDVNNVRVVEEEEEKEEEEEEEEEEGKEDSEECPQEYYEWNMIPMTYPEDRQTGVTIKGDTDEYFEASKKIFNLLNNKGMKYCVNDRDIRILDNVENKPIKIEVKSKKKPAGKVNVKIYGVNKLGHATMMITKVSGGTLTHVKTVAFKIIKYLLDGLIDGEIDDNDIENMRISNKFDKKGKDLQCELCDKTLKTIQGMKIHNSKKHAEKEKELSESKCQLCNLTFGTESLLLKHVSQCKVKTILCEMCAQTFTNESEKKSHMLAKHKNKNKHKCNVCNYTTKREVELKRHNRDEHEETTCSTSPRPKKRKKDTKQENMETTESLEKSIQGHDLTKEGEVFWTDARELPNKDVEMEILKEEEKDDKELETKDKKVKKEQTKTLKPYLRELPHAVQQLIGERFVLFPIDGDGACGPRSFAAWIYEDPSLGPNLARNMNRLFVKHWDYWKDKFEYPFIRDIGLGEQVKCENEEQLLDFFLDSKDGAFMWRGHEDFAVIANAYQIKITVIIVNGMEDKNPQISEIEPNPDFKNHAEIVPGKVPDMMILHEKNVHYSLIIPEDCRLAEIGSLDLQRSENVGKSMANKANNKHIKKSSTDVVNVNFVPNVCEEIVNRKNTNKQSTNLGEKLSANDVHTVEDENVHNSDTNNMSMRMQKYESLEKRLAVLEEKMALIIDRCGFLEKENSFLNEKIKESKKEEKTHLKKQHGESEEDDNEIVVDKDLLQTQTRRGFKRVRPCIQPGPVYQNENVEDKESVGDECKEELVLLNLKNSGFERVNPQTQSLRKNDKKQINCEKCKKNFSSQDQIDNHKSDHTCQMYTCDICGEEFLIRIQLNEHVKNKHSNYKVKDLKQYNCQDCAFQGERGIDLKKHSATSGHTPSECIEDCSICGGKFVTYSLLMNHMKKEHPSKISSCWYFNNTTCKFEADECWSSHEVEPQISQENSNFECRKCSKTFSRKGDLMKHIKKDHPMTAQKCRNFLTGACDRSEDMCWFVHSKSEENENKKVSFDLNVKELDENTDFQKAQEKTPPDQMNHLIEVIQNLTLRVKNIEKMSQICK